MSTTRTRSPWVWVGLAALAATPALAEVAPAGSCCSGGKCC